MVGVVGNVYKSYVQPLVKAAENGAKAAENGVKAVREKIKVETKIPDGYDKELTEYQRACVNFVDYNGQEFDEMGNKVIKDTKEASALPPMKGEPKKSWFQSLKTLVTPWTWKKEPAVTTNLPDTRTFWQKTKDFVKNALHIADIDTTWGKIKTAVGVVVSYFASLAVPVYGIYDAVATGAEFTLRLARVTKENGEKIEFPKLKSITNYIASLFQKKSDNEQVASISDSKNKVY